MFGIRLYGLEVGGERSFRYRFLWFNTIVNMEDGLYQVVTKYLCAGFVIKSARVTLCAPILRKKFEYWKTIAKKVGRKH